MKKIVLLILMGCSQPVEPKFCYTCHERNFATSKHSAIVGEAFTKYCNLAPADIAKLEAESYRDKIVDSSFVTHIVECSKAE